MEGEILLYIQEHIRIMALNPIMVGITHLGDSGLLWIVLSVALLFPKKTRKVGAMGLTALALSYLINNVVLKNLVARVRPFDAVEGLKILISKPKDLSFPSGHTAASFCAAVIFARKLPKKFGIPALVLAILIGFSRLYVGVHYPTDVLGGFISGLLIGCFTVTVYDMEKCKKEHVLMILSGVILTCASNSYLFIKKEYLPVPVMLLLVVAGGVLPLYSGRNFPDLHTKLCHYGNKMLKIFVASVISTVILQIVLLVYHIYSGEKGFLWGLLICIVVENIVFWDGMIIVYVSSVQLGIRMRTIGWLVGLIPIVNLIMLFHIIHLTSDEVNVEVEKYEVNLARKEEQICQCKYPILLVHGVFFRDFRYLNYWGRIPKELKDNGAKIFYGNHQSALSVADSAKELSLRIKGVLAETESEKVNIIAHSKGGLDCRYAIDHLGMGESIASLTTINTPHRGCEFAEYLLEHTAAGFQDKIAKAYNAALLKLGDENPDFMVAVTDLTKSSCVQEGREPKVYENILCQSVGSKLNHATSGRFPLNLSYHLVKQFDGPNDGLVGEKSFPWGEKFTFLTTEGKRGISHGDMIDLNRENIPGFDVREFYVQLVADLKKRGL